LVGSISPSTNLSLLCFPTASVSNCRCCTAILYAWPWWHCDTWSVAKSSICAILHSAYVSSFPDWMVIYHPQYECQLHSAWLSAASCYVYWDLVSISKGNLQICCINGAFFFVLVYGDVVCYGPAGSPPGGGAGPGGGAAPGASGAQAADRLPPSDSYSSLGFSYL
jgi:hypothetical protein